MENHDEIKKKQKPGEQVPIPFVEQPTEEEKAPPVLLITTEERDALKKEDENFEDVIEDRKRKGFYD